MKLWQKILIGLVMGSLLGWGMTATGLDSYSNYLSPFVKTFLNLIQMLVVLLVFSSMTVGVTSIHDPKKLGRIGLKSLFLYLSTTVIAICIGLSFAYLMKPGMGAGFESSYVVNVDALPGAASLLEEMIPRNPVASLAEGRVLQIIVFSLFLGIAINITGERGKPLLRLLESIADVMYRMTTIVMEFAPYGVFVTMAWVVSKYGIEVLKALMEFLICNYVACFAHVIIVYVGILVFVARLKPWNFFKGMVDAILFAFSTTSSSATLPVSLHCVQENLGVSKNISNFVLPLGATVNMNGAAISQAIAAVFVAQSYGIDLDAYSILMIVVTATISAIGAAGVPGSSLTMMAVIFTSVGLPLEGIALVAGVDRVREMVTTVVNILGDSVVAVYVAKTEGELNIDQYNKTELVEITEAALD